MDFKTNIKKIIASTVVLFMLIALGLSLTWRKNYLNKYVIGLVYVPSSAFHEYVNNALIQKIKADKRFAIQEFTASSWDDLILVNNACNDAISSSANLVIGTGMKCSKSLVQLSQKRNSQKPILFLGISDPVKYELVSSVEKPGGSVTGIESNPPGDYVFNPIDLLLIIKPNVHKILLPYSMGTGTHESRAPELQRLYKKAGLEVTLLPMHNLNDALSQVAGLISEHDTLMYLENDAVAMCASGLGKLASQHGITMFSGSIEGIKDSALSYAADPACLADIAFEMAKEILIDKKNPGDMPVRQANVARNLIIDTKLCKEQGLSDIDIPKIISTIQHDERFALVRDHIIVK